MVPLAASESDSDFLVFVNDYIDGEWTQISSVSLAGPSPCSEPEILIKQAATLRWR